MLWQPESGCGDQCRDGADATVPRALAAIRVLATVGVLLSGFVLLPVLRGGASRIVARGVLAAMGVRVLRRGPSVKPGSMVVANHVSWIDILVLLATGRMTMLAKGEVGAWPGIGLLARLSGVIFLDRARPKRLPHTVAEVRDALRAGRTVTVFPEGTTYCGASQGRFRPATFQSAIDANAPVVPVSINYDSPAAAFVGDDTLWDSVRRIAALRSLTVTVVTAPALRPAPAADRRALAKAAQASLGVAGYRLAA